MSPFKLQKLSLDNARCTAEKGMCWVVIECNMCNMCNIKSMIEIFNQGLGNGCNICINEGGVEVKWHLKSQNQAGHEMWVICVIW